MTSPHEVEFNHDDTALVEDIAERWMGVCSQHGREVDPLSVLMDVEAANGVNGNPALDLGRLMAFDEFNFTHDMAGIERQLNRETGKVGGFFRPRCAKPEALS